MAWAVHSSYSIMAIASENSRSNSFLRGMKLPKIKIRHGDSSESIITCLAAADQSVRVMFAAGGTGGHVFPAIAIADALTASNASVLVQFAGTHHRIEASAVPQAGYAFQSIPAVGIRRPLLSPRNLLLPFQLAISIWVALRLLLDFRPHVVVGTGGYVSVPICLAAALCSCPFVIQEQNAFPGLANKILARFATTVFVAFSAALAYLPKHKCVVCGNPIRASLRQPVSKAAALQHFFPNCPTASVSSDSSYSDDDHKSGHATEPTSKAIPTPVVILVLGGSLGAKSINQAVTGMIVRMLDQWPERFVIWQTGSKNHKDVVDTVCNHERLFISKFLNDMQLAYSAADLVVARSGAITCSELLTVGKPSILIPSKNVVDDHQAKNALALLDMGASKVIWDMALTSKNLEASINELLGDHDEMLSMHERALKAAVPDAAILIAKEVLSLAEHSASLRIQRGWLASFLNP